MIVQNPNILSNNVLLFYLYFHYHQVLTAAEDSLVKQILAGPDKLFSIVN